ncbi:MAG TPA: hypothetical protein VEM40_12575 [Nitrospirota bacterium]|nr:hypothetical protein [Nitrospirota bacterium]
MVVPLPEVATPFKVIPAASVIVHVNWLDCPDAITEGEAVKEEMAGAAGAEIASLEPLPLQAERERRRISKIIYVTFLCIDKMCYGSTKQEYVLPQQPVGDRKLPKNNFSC